MTNRKGLNVAHTSPSRWAYLHVRAGYGVHHAAFNFSGYIYWQPPSSWRPASTASMFIVGSSA